MLQTAAGTETVEMACLKISCSRLPDSRTTENLSKLNPACELDASDKVNRDIDAIAADVV
jgi:hypothetical protein